MSDAEAALLLEELRRLKQENELLRQKLDALARRVFGARSEQLDENQLHLLLQEAEAPGPFEGKESGPEADLAEPPRPSKASPAKPQGPQASSARASAGHRRNHRARAGQSRPAGMAADRRGSQRAAGL